MAIAARAWETLKPVMYPESDGKPMAETDTHRREMSYAIDTLAEYYVGDPEVYVAGNLLVYYVEGDPTSRFAPDVFVVKGVPKRERRIYKLWEEKVSPQLVIEVSSRGTRLEDLGLKRELYRILGVEEYFQWDPLDEYLDPSLQGYRLTEDAQYQRILPERDGSLRSEVLGLDLRRKGDRLRFVDSSTGEPVLAPVERARVESERARVASERAQAESERAQAESERAQAESERAQAESERAQAESERARVASERAQVASERARVASERAEVETSMRLDAEHRLVQEARARTDAERRAQEAEGELERLRALLKQDSRG